METRDMAFTLYKKGMGCTEISKKLGVSLNTVKSWKKRYWDAQKGAPKKRTPSHQRVHLQNAPSKTRRLSLRRDRISAARRKGTSMLLAIMAGHRREIRMR